MAGINRSLKKRLPLLIVMGVLVAALLVLVKLDYVRFGYHGKLVYFPSDTERSLQKAANQFKGLFR